MSRVWVMTMIYDDEPFAAPGVLVGSSPEAVVDAWRLDEAASIDLDCQGFPVWESLTIESRWMKNVGARLIANAEDPDNVVCWDGQNYALQDRPVAS